jgi:hypothetical protein
MPLDSKHLPEETIMSFKGIPYDDTNERRDFSYSTKVEIYDRMCGNCGFKRILVKIGEEDNPGENTEQEFRSIEEATAFAQATGGTIIRSCQYPPDLTECFGKIIYPSLNEIIMNTCRFWKSKNIEIESDYEVYEKENSPINIE